jgi:hypothetical protein
MEGECQANSEGCVDSRHWAVLLIKELQLTSLTEGHWSICLCLILWSLYVWPLCVSLRTSRLYHVALIWNELIVPEICSRRNLFLWKWRSVMFHSDIFVGLKSGIIHAEHWTRGKRVGTLSSSHSLASHLLCLVLWCFRKEAFLPSVNQIRHDVRTGTRGSRRHLQEKER